MGDTATYGGLPIGSVIHRFTDHTGYEVIRRDGSPDGGAASAAFSPDRHQVVVNFSNGAVALWRIDTALDELVSWTKASRYIPESTCEQRALHRTGLLCPKSISTPTATVTPPLE